MAVPVFDTVTWGYPTSATTDFSTGTNDGNDGRHTAAGSNRIVVIGIEIFDNVDDITNVDYDGAACTKLSRIDYGSHALSYYYILNPNTTANAVTRVRCTSANDSRVAVYSMTGAAQQAPVAGPITNTAIPGTSLSVTIDTTGFDNCLLLGWAASASCTEQPGANTTEREAVSSCGSFFERDVVTGGSNALAITLSSANVGMIGAAWQAVTSSPSTVRMLRGIGS